MSTPKTFILERRSRARVLLAKTLRDGEPLQAALNTIIDHIASFATT